MIQVPRPKFLSLCLACLLLPASAREEGKRVAASPPAGAPAPQSPETASSGESVRVWGVAGPASAKGKPAAGMPLEAQAKLEASGLVAYTRGVKVELKGGNLSLSPGTSSSGTSPRTVRVERLSRGAVAVAVETPLAAPAGEAPLAAYTLRVPLWSDPGAASFSLRFLRELSESAKRELTRHGRERGRLFLRSMSLEREGEGEAIRAEIVLLPEAGP
jgi:hypothetical protein